MDVLSSLEKEKTQLMSLWLAPLDSHLENSVGGDSSIKTLFFQLKKHDMAALKLLLNGNAWSLQSMAVTSVR